MERHCPGLARTEALGARVRGKRPPRAQGVEHRLHRGEAVGCERPVELGARDQLRHLNRADLIRARARARLIAIESLVKGFTTTLIVQLY
jgi:hypothetical protein